jgi:hypothetical protein
MSISRPDESARLYALQRMVCLRMDDLLADLGVSLVRSRRMYVGPCPVHGGDNPMALNLYHSGDIMPGYWRCNTRHCEKSWKKTVVGFVRGVLSAQRRRALGFTDAVKYLCAFVGKTRLSEIEPDFEGWEKADFARSVATLTRGPEQGSQQALPGLTRATVRKWLQIPAEYFLRRGWGREVLDRYDVGLYPAQGRPLSGRVAVPVYDEDYRGVLGFTARSVLERCGSCGLYHPGDCPAEVDARKRYSKWTNTDGLPRESALYNYWFAKKEIARAGVAVLVEGPGEAWRLAEAGIECGLAMLGAELADAQQVALERSGAMAVVVATNMDEAGRAAAEAIRKRLGRAFRVRVADLPANDLGDMAPADVAALLGPMVAALSWR